MISIQKFLRRNQETEETRLHVVRALIRGIGESAAEGDPDDCARFRESIEGISAQLSDQVAGEELLVHAGAVIEVLKGHTRRANTFNRLQKTELQSMVKMLTSTVGSISAFSAASVGQLGEIEKQVTDASEISDMRAIKARLTACLTDIRKEAGRQSKEMSEMIEQLNQGLAQASVASRSAGDGPTDPVTGLPLRAAAEAAIAAPDHPGMRLYVAVMVLDRLQTLNARFGKEAGDGILMKFTQMVRGKMSSGDRLFRWSGPVLVALMLRKESLEIVRGEVSRIMETRLDYSIQTASRSVLLPVTARWTLLPAITAPRLTYQRIEAFAAVPDAHG